MNKKNLNLFILLLILPLFPNLQSWETAIAGVITSPPAQGLNGRIYCTADDRALHCLDNKSGKEYWFCRTARRLEGFTVVSPDGSILVKDEQNILISISPGGHILWRFTLPGPLQVPPAVDAYGSIYLLGKNGFLCCLNRTGTLSWKKQLHFDAGDLFVASQKLFFMAGDQTLVLRCDSEEVGIIPKGAVHLVFDSSSLYWETAAGEWWAVDSRTLEFSASVSPFKRKVIFPDPGLLITRKGKIVAGRKDWFMEALDEGEYLSSLDFSQIVGKKNLKGRMT